MRFDPRLMRWSMFNVIHYEAVSKIDFIVLKDAPYRINEFERRRTVEVDGHPISIVSAEDLVLSKLVWAKDSPSELQLRDVRSIITSQAALDWAYMEKWAPSLSGRRPPSRSARMNDTQPDVDAKFAALFRQRSGSDRVRMACEMFDLARALLVADIKAQHPGIADAALRVKIFERMYGGDFTPDERVQLGARFHRRYEALKVSRSRVGPDDRVRRE
jgi:hypothetical protein